MPALSTFLTFRFIEDRLGSWVARDEADLAGQELDFHLSQEIEEQQRLLRDYLSLEADDADSLGSNIHEWFLERIANSPQLVVTEQTELQLSRAFFFGGSALIPYLAVSALLSLYRIRETPHLPRERPKSAVSLIVREILRIGQEGQLADWVDHEKYSRLEQLSDILIDLHYLAGVDDASLVLVALDELLHLEMPDFTNRLRTRLRLRIADLSPERGRELTALF
jgi:hypothetical protein